MSEFIIKKANKKAKKLRLGLSAAAGFGKTYGALLMAYGITKDWSKICVIDSERDSACLYADLGEYSTINLEKPYTPERYINAIITAENAGFEVIIIDSITHEWEGEGGCLEIHTKIGGRYQDWGQVTPRHNAFVNKILSSKCHIITTVRRKQDYEMTNENGKVKVKKVGTKEVTREGFEYELDINFEINNANHMCNVSKDRTGLFTGQPDFVISEETGRLVKEWANKGTNPIDEALEAIRDVKNLEGLKAVHSSYNSILADNEDFKTALKKKSEEFI